MTKFYTGIGSRNTPDNVLELMTQTARKLNAEGWTLRSGGADGADTAFEEGAGENKVIYLPWRGFNGKEGIVFSDIREKDRGYAMRSAACVHPAWGNLKDSVKLLHSRNIFQVLGHEGEFVEPSKFLICYAETQGTSVKGGTRTAVECAKMFGVNVYNLYVKEDRERIEKWLT